MQAENPNLMNRVMEMTQGKNENELRQIVMNVAKERGVNLSNFARGFGINI
jgi:hypothetical protein